VFLLLLFLKRRVKSTAAVFHNRHYSDSVWAIYDMINNVFALRTRCREVQHFDAVNVN